MAGLKAGKLQHGTILVIIVCFSKKDAYKQAKTRLYDFF
jgi:hypothetical protein